MQNRITICCLKESGPPSRVCHNDWDDDTNLEIPKLSEVLSISNVCRRYISAKSCSEKALNALSLQNEMYTLYARRVKQSKLSDFFKAQPSSK